MRKLDRFPTPRIHEAFKSTLSVAQGRCSYAVGAFAIVGMMLYEGGSTLTWMVRSDVPTGVFLNRQFDSPTGPIYDFSLWLLAFVVAIAFFPLCALGLFTFEPRSSPHSR